MTNHLLIVEHDPLTGELLQAALNLHRSTWQATLVRKSTQALALLKEQSFDVVITDFGCGSPLPKTEQEVSQVQAYFDKLQKTMKADRVILLADPDQDLAEELAVLCLPRPVDLILLLNNLDRLLGLEQESVLRGVGVGSVLQILATERKNMALTVRSRARTGLLQLHEGRLRHAVTGRLKGREAAIEILNWPEPEVRLVPLNGKREVSMDESLPHLLLDASVESDNKSSAAAHAMNS
ncbi:MAG: DUF4388 domain-containing protein [Verrucomicrobiales bacterium]